MPILMPENFEAYALSQHALGGAIDGMGGLRYEPIHHVLLSEGFEPGTSQYRVLFRKMLHYIAAWWDERRPKGKT